MAWFIAIPLLASGCLSDEGPGAIRPGDGVAPPDGLHEVTMEDLHFAGTVEECSAGICMDVTASNEGDQEYHVSDVCVSPFTEAMFDGGDPIQHREPEYHCEAFGTTPMEPNTQIPYQSSWDGRTWNDSQQAYQDASPGEYTWQVTFRAYRSAEGGTPIDLVLQFPVTITGE